MRIEYIPRAIADRFANEFAGKKKKVGFSAKEISDYFLQYSNSVKHYDYYGIKPSRFDLFVESLYQLNPDQQYYSLNDLTFFEYKSKYDYPNENIRKELRYALHNCYSNNPIGLAFSEIRDTAFRKDWIESMLKINVNPPEAITSARTLLETTLKTILDLRSAVDNSKGDLSRLTKQTLDMLDFKKGESKYEQMFISGLSSVINGIACVSNNAGDRHGTISGVEIDDPKIAELVVNSCGTIGLFIIKLHLFKDLGEVQ